MGRKKNIFCCASLFVISILKFNLSDACLKVPRTIKTDHTTFSSTDVSVRSGQFGRHQVKIDTEVFQYDKVKNNGKGCWTILILNEEYLPDKPCFSQFIKEMDSNQICQNPNDDEPQGLFGKNNCRDKTDEEKINKATSSAAYVELINYFPNSKAKKRGVQVSQTGRVRIDDENGKLFLFSIKKDGSIDPNGGKIILEVTESDDTNPFVTFKASLSNSGKGDYIDKIPLRFTGMRARGGLFSKRPTEKEILEQEKKQLLTGWNGGVEIDLNGYSTDGSSCSLKSTSISNVGIKKESPSFSSFGRN